MNYEVKPGRNNNYVLLADDIAVYDLNKAEVPDGLSEYEIEQYVIEHFEALFYFY